MNPGKAILRGLICAAAFASAAVAQTPVRPNLVIVGDTPPLAEYLDSSRIGSTIRSTGSDAVDTAKPGDLVLIAPGRDDSGKIAADLKAKGARPVMLVHGGLPKNPSVPHVDLDKASLISGLKGLRDQSIIQLLSAPGRAAPTAPPDAVAVVVQPPPRTPPEEFQRWLNLPELGVPALPSIFLVGDSTVRNGRGDGYDGQFGWGDPFASYFDPAKVNVVNRAVGGTGVRTFIGSGYWDRVLALVKPGDLILIQFGHNNDSLAGIGEEQEERENARTKQTDLLHSFGWYLRKYVAEARARGAIPILCSLVPRKVWREGKIVRGKDTFAGWTEQVAAAEKVPFLDLNEIIAQRYDALGQPAVEPLFADANTHTTWAGAVLSAERVVSVLKGLTGNPAQRFFAAVAAPATPPAGRAATPPPQSVSPRDSEPWTPSDFAAVKKALPTLIIAGDSTADKGPDAWHRGWAAVLNDYFDQTRINLVNRARGGRSFRSFVREGLWDQLTAEIKPGDIVMIQFGHNDGGDINAANGRPDLPGLGEEEQTITRADGSAETVHTFGWYARKYVRDVRAKGGTPVIMGTTVYNRWPDGVFSRTPSSVNTWLKAVADSEKVPFLDHTSIIGDRYEQMGEAAVKPFFPADFLHTSTPGAVVNAEMFVAGVKNLNIKPLVDALNARGAAIESYRPKSR